MTPAKTSRGKALRWLTTHRGLTEQPAGSNCDARPDGIRAAQLRLGKWLIGQAWCGVWFCNALLAAGVNFGHTQPYALASVENIVSLAQGKVRPFRGWVNPKTDRKWSQRVLRGDGVVLFGHDHVETLRSAAWPYRKLGYIITEGGNTSFDDLGSQSNGGCSARKKRRISDVDGFALVDYPG